MAIPSPLSAPERRRLAEAAGINAAYLYQCLTGRRDMGATVACRVEVATGGELHRRILCPNNWRTLWPELEHVNQSSEQEDQIPTPS